MSTAPNEALAVTRARIGVVSNPNSGKNRRSPQRLAGLERVLGDWGVLRSTRERGELRDVVEEFYELGCDYWICDGGDGTLHWLLSTAREVGHRRRRPWPMVIPANGGTIDFVAMKAGVRGEVDSILRGLTYLLARGEEPPMVELDTLAVRGLRERGGGTEEEVRRVGFAAALGGASRRFFDKLYEYPLIDAWRILDVIGKATLGCVATTTPSAVRPYCAPHLQRYAAEVFEPLRARVDVDGRSLDFDLFSTVQVGSIDINLGGVVRTFRHAAADGVLHAQALGGSHWRVIANLPNILLGTPIWGRERYDGPATSVQATVFPGACLAPIIDGELLPPLRSIELTAGPKLRVPIIGGGPMPA